MIAPHGILNRIMKPSSATQFYEVFAFSSHYTSTIQELITNFQPVANQTNPQRVRSKPTRIEVKQLLIE